MGSTGEYDWSEGFLDISIRGIWLKYVSVTRTQVLASVFWLRKMVKEGVRSAVSMQ